MSSPSTDSYSGNFKRRRSDDMEKRQDDAMSTVTTASSSWEEMSMSTAAATELSPPTPTSQLRGRRPKAECLSWKNYFMAIACLNRERSKEPNASERIGACIVKDNKILGTGYNGLPLGMKDSEYPWSNFPPVPNDSKDLNVIPAAENAILFKTTLDLGGATIYLTTFPCHRSANCIIQSGIKQIEYLKPLYLDEEHEQIVAKLAGPTNKLTSNKDLEVTCKLFRPSKEDIVINFYS